MSLRMHSLLGHDTHSTFLQHCLPSLATHRTTLYYFYTAPLPCATAAACLYRFLHHLLPAIHPYHHATHTACHASGTQCRQVPTHCAVLHTLSYMCYNSGQNTIPASVTCKYLPLYYSALLLFYRTQPNIQICGHIGRTS